MNSFWPLAKASELDVAGGAGRHATNLVAERGMACHAELIDISEVGVQQRKKMQDGRLQRIDS